MSRMRIEKAIILVSDGKCFYCSGNAKHADHVVPISKGGPDTLGNLVPSCSDCNLKKQNNILPGYSEAFALAHAANLAKKVKEKGWKVYGSRKPKQPADDSWMDEFFAKIRPRMADPEFARAFCREFA